MPKINAAGLALVEDFEKCFLFTYDDGADEYPPIPFTGGAPKGTLTNGWGHTGSDVHANQTITQTEADGNLAADLAEAERETAAAVQVVLSPNEFSALVSFQYNTGALGSSPGVGLINENRFQEAWDDHFCLYIHDADGHALEGLVRRRAAERALFFSA